MKYWSDLVRRTCLVALLLCVATRVPAAGAPYGEDFVRYGHDRSDTAPALAENLVPGTPARAGDDQAFLREVEALEAELGPYASGLDEPLSDLGRYYLARGDFDRALDVFTRAMHVVRVNDGLQSERQLPLLRATLDTYRLSGDYTALDERYDYYYSMFGYGQPPYTELRLRAALAYLRWQREALRLRVDNRDARRLLTLLRHNDYLIDEVASDDTLAPRWQAELALSQVKNHYLLQELVDEPEPVYTSRHVSPMPEFGGVAERSPVLDDLERRRVGVRRLGSNTLENALERLPEDADTELRARLLLALGDWHQWHAEQRDAEHYYLRAVTTLSEAGRQDLLRAWFSEPVELPDNGVFFQPAFGEPAPETGFVALTYNVSASGRVSNVMLAEEVAPELERDAERIKRRFRATRFRPRWAGGFAEPVAAITRRYVWLD